MTENNFDTTVAYHVTDEGDKILYPFSPPIYQSYVDNKFTKELIEEGRKLTLKDNDHNHKLAGNLKYGRSYHYNDDYISKVEPYLKGHVEKFFNSLISQFTRFGGNYSSVDSLLHKQSSKHRTLERGKLELDSLWINFSKKHDYNPPHTHTGVLSFVIFCQVPKEIFKVQADSNSQRAGEIHFSYGEQISPLTGSEFIITPTENLILIFPNKLTHYVPPYWVNAERISVSGNFVVI